MITFEDAYSWLNKYDTSHISASSGSLIEQVREALRKGRVDETRGLLQQVNDLACNLRDSKEVNEILIECGHISFILDDLAEAESILDDSVFRAWSDPHRRAVIRWLLGCVQWQSMPTRQLAVISWRNSLSDFERLAREAGLTSEQHIWYQETSDKLHESMLEAMGQAGNYVDIVEKPPRKTVEREAFAEPEDVTKASPISEPMANEPPFTTRLSEPRETQNSDILQLFTISEEIPAGDFGPSGIDPFPIGTVEIDSLTINGHPYSIHSTRGRKIITLPFDQKFSVVKVKGDSMDQENITEKDYVLLRKVDTPANGDIVMAEIVGIDSRATLKRYSRELDSIMLKPHSSNPDHKPFIFKSFNEGFYLRGVVVAVLKPI
jgi:phage repressor protein C with HTH and peptisase S24 domain